MNRNTLIVITGPTGIGKTAAAIEIATALGTEIISADSRQIYKEIPIGTAAPSPQELASVKHHFIAIKSVTDYYSAAQFEQEAIALLPSIFERSQSHCAVMCGGSMMYVDAVCDGIDEMPTISPEVRDKVLRLANQCGMEAITAQLELLDPQYLAMADPQNHKRLIHALEVCYQSGVPYSSLRTGKKKKRDFDIVKIGLQMPREQLFDRINSRVDKMIEAGLEQEARSVYHLRCLNALNTVGFKELFAHLDGMMDLDTAVGRIKKNTRVYAKQQLRWFAKDPEIKWFSPLSLPVSDLVQSLSQPR